jgi:hypothetical protein
MKKKPQFVLGHCDTHAPKYVVTCGGMHQPSWHMTQKAAKKKVRELREQWSGTGVFPTVTIMKTDILFQKEVDMEF